MVQICINLRLAGIKKSSKVTGYKFVSCAVSDENFEKLSIAANELNVNMPTCMEQHTICYKKELSANKLGLTE